MCDIVFSLEQDLIAIDFSLGDALPEEGAGDEKGALEFAELLLSAICDDYGVSEDGAKLHLVKKIGPSYAG